MELLLAQLLLEQDYLVLIQLSQPLVSALLWLSSPFRPLLCASSLSCLSPWLAIPIGSSRLLRPYQPRVRLDHSIQAMEWRPTLELVQARVLALAWWQLVA